MSTPTSNEGSDTRRGYPERRILAWREARPGVTLADVLPVLVRARHTAIYSRQHYLVIDALIEGVLHDAVRPMSRKELLTLYRAIGWVHLACYGKHITTTIDALDCTIARVQRAQER